MSGTQQIIQQPTVNSTTNLQTRSGNRVAIEFGGVEIGLLQNLSSTDDYAPEPASGIGDIHVVEHVPTMARHNIECSCMVLNRGSMIAAGLAPENGDGALRGNVFDVSVYDKDSGALIRTIRNLTYASGRMEFSKHAIVVQSASFLGTDVSGTAA